MATLSHSVMHAEFDPTRAPMLQAFLRRLGEPTLVVCDTHRDGIYKTAWRAWEAFDPSCDWHIVFQDDMHPVPGALERMRAVLDDIPQNAICSFFQPAIGYENVVWNYVKPWLEKGPGVRLYPRPAILWGGSIAVPTKHIPRMVHDIRKFMPVEIWNEADDEKICFWAWGQGLDCVAYAPSLLEHVGWERSVTKGYRHEEWKRGVLISGEDDLGDPKWRDMVETLERNSCMIEGNRVYTPEKNSVFAFRQEMLDFVQASSP